MTTKIRADKTIVKESRLICEGCGSTKAYGGMLTLNKVTRVVLLCLGCRELSNAE